MLAALDPIRRAPARARCALYIELVRVVRCESRARRTEHPRHYRQAPCSPSAARGHQPAARKQRVHHRRVLEVAAVVKVTAVGKCASTAGHSACGTTTSSPWAFGHMVWPSGSSYASLSKGWKRDSSFTDFLGADEANAAWIPESCFLARRARSSCWPRHAPAADREQLPAAAAEWRSSLSRPRHWLACVDLSDCVVVVVVTVSSCRNRCRVSLAC